MGSSVVQVESSSSSPNLKNLKWIYDVFLSFRGEDTRSNFTSHLDMFFRQKGVNFFIDDKLDRGGQISESLRKSIEGSRISIVIFSENYTSSTWCLDELVKIIECMKSKGQIVLPIFYKVDPSEVRKQTGRFGETLAKHEAKFASTKIQTWKEALTIAAGLSGWDLATYRKESDLIQDIVKEVLSKVNHTQLLHVAMHPVGIDSQLEAMELVSHVVSNGVQMVGIYGMGGLGKTTLAKALYNKIANEFEGHSFLSNVREASKQFNGLVQLQENLLYAILKVNLEVNNVDRGITIIRDRLCSKKVLIVLDDVDKLDQLEKLVGGRDWFGRGSKIIVTTRNKQLLSSHGFDKMHDIQGLDQDKALELFSWHAFKESHPSSNYVDLSKRATSYCKGLPLALVVLGSSLCNRDQSKWQSILYEFENSLTKDIKDILQISFNGLEDKVKDIFLDISCFFVGEDVDRIKDMLEACDLNPNYGITILMDLSLITIEDNRLKMHDLIRQMGQTIVCRESSEPEKKSRLWVAKDIINMLKENSGTDAVKAIKLDLPFLVQEKLVPIDPKAFKKMKNLRLLIIRNIKFSKNIFECLPNKLKWIECCRSIGFPSFPISSYVNDQLVGLDVKHSFVERLGKILENSRRLKHVDFSGSFVLEEILDFSAALNLKELYLRDCGSLKMIHESVGSLSKLITLDFQGCVNLKKLPSYFMLKSLEVLNLTKCIQLEEIPDLSVASNLKELRLSECSNLRIIHGSTSRSLNKLVTLDLNHCDNVKRLPCYVMSKSLELFILTNFMIRLNLEKDSYFSLAKFPSNLKLEYLKVLNLCGCENLEEITDFSISSNLEILNLTDCINLRMIHESTRSLDKLVHCNLYNCKNLEMLPSFSAALNLKLLNLSKCINLRTVHESIGSLDKLVTLELKFCYNLEKLPTYLKLKSLDSLNLDGCIKLEQLPEFDKNMKSLRKMMLDQTGIKELPPSIGHLIGLQYLSLKGCTNLIALPSEIHLLKSLYELCLRECSKLDMFPQRSSLNYSQESLCSKLTILNLENCNISNVDFLETLSNVSSSLSNLNLSGNKFSCLPSLQNFKSLKSLELRHCKFLQNIANFPTHCLEKVDARGCESLVISPDYIADIIFRPQDNLERHRSRRLILMNSEIPNYFNNQTTESSVSVSFEHDNNPNKKQALAVCVVFKVDGDSCEATAAIDCDVYVDNKLSITLSEGFGWSKSEFMWIIRTPTLRCLDMKALHKITVWFRVMMVYKSAIVSIRRHGVLVVDAIQTVTDDFAEERDSRKRKRDPKHARA